MSKDEDLNSLIISVVAVAEKLHQEGRPEDAHIILDFLNAAKFKLRKKPRKEKITLLV